MATLLPPPPTSPHPSLDIIELHPVIPKLPHTHSYEFLLNYESKGLLVSKSHYVVISADQWLQFGHNETCWNLKWTAFCETLLAIGSILWAGCEMAAAGIDRGNYPYWSHWFRLLLCACWFPGEILDFVNLVKIFLFQPNRPMYSLQICIRHNISLNT